MTEITAQSATGTIRFLATSSLSKRITGNEIDGDDRIVWDRRFLDQVKEAAQKFDELIKEGFKAFLVRKDGKKSERQMFRFDPNAEEIIMVPPLTGG
jgi:hypothetical protein